MAYKLSAQLLGHSSDVRAVHAISSTQILSSSRDSTARIWHKNDPSAHGSAWSQQHVLKDHHEGFINAACSVEWNGQRYAITGGQDTLIQVWDIENPSNPYKTLIGHQANVCCLSVQKTGKAKGRVVSGSWDTTAKVWTLDQAHPVLALEGSAMSIWDVLALPGDEDLAEARTLTASADQMIRLYKGSKQVDIFKGHTQAVRALALLPDGNTFASAGNDGSIRTWSLDGFALQTFGGHDSFVYTLDVIPSTGDIVSGGEDRSVRIWDGKSGNQKQTLTIPAISIWTVSVLPNDDIVCGSSDGTARVFSTDPVRIADAALLKEFEDALANSAVDANQVGDVKKSDLPDESALSKAGTKEGQVAMVKTASGSVEAHQWDSSKGRWQKIGTVVDAVGSGRKQLYEGQEYDYVFDVDVSEGQPPLKLPFNVTENPYAAAEKFLQTNDLPSTFVDQIVEFIRKNTQGVQLNTSSDFVDPYTGASSYRSLSAPAPPAANSSYSNPYSNASNASAPTSSLLPHKTLLSFTQSNLPAIKGKIISISQQLESDEKTSAIALGTAEIATLDSAIATPAKSTTGTDEQLLFTKLLAWPPAHRFPVLDLIRALSVSAGFTDHISTVLNNVAAEEGATQKETEINSMLSLRILANTFLSSQDTMQSMAEEILQTILIIGTGSLSKLGRVALATLCLNYSILSVSGSLSADSASDVMDMSLSLLNDTASDSEACYRALMAIGNLYCSAHKQSLAGKTPQVKSAVLSTSQRYGSEKRVKDLERAVLIQL